MSGLEGLDAGGMDRAALVDQVMELWAGQDDLTVMVICSRQQGGVMIEEFHHSSLVEAEVRFEALQVAARSVRGVFMDVVRCYPAPKKGGEG